ncbi:LOW QUALITY PROTEIN: S-linalool synthase [Primulina eburnea]|uniref:LOW QUALITY PROTEIN: S-linalool synthase n=1 Tax=Primulina eburnea TaxID=1245227 RepID=UPI003C6C65B4
MGSSLCLVQSLVFEVQKELFSDNINIQSFVSPSAYDTAWLAMIPAENLNRENQCRGGPMFESSLNWVINNQKEGGFWGESDVGGHLPTIDALPATLVCMVALKKWNRGLTNINKGLAFIESKTAEEILLKLYEYQNLPRWFVLVFTAAIELAEAAALEVVFQENLRGPIADIFFKRRQILSMENKALEKSETGSCHLPLLSYLEALPMSSIHDFDEQEITKRLNYDGSFFQSPSATARAFMATYNVNCLSYLESLVQNFPDGGVPAKYPVDEELINLCMVDHIQRLGLGELFHKEMDQILHRIHSDERQNYSIGDALPMKLFKDALTFRLLRMQGYYQNPESFCWFLNDAKVMVRMQENPEQFISAMYSVFTATDISFPGESKSDEARIFARIILQNATCSVRDFEDHNFVISNGLRNVMKYEMDVPWTARLDHLNHRKWIEESNKSPLWVGKASFYRLSCLDNKKLAQLAVENYEYRQSMYRQEMEEMKRWSEEGGLSKMGFGRDKTDYTYYAIAASACHPFNSIMRLAMAKSATIVVFADDFYDMEGSVSELHLLTTAIQRWEGEGLTGHSKTIFDALDDFINKFVANFPSHEGSKTVANLRKIWSETFTSWMVEKTWSLMGYVASMDEYLENATISVAIHTIALPTTSSFLKLSSSNGTQNLEYHEITKLLMAIARLLNDSQSYQKEEEEGKMNFVHLHMKQNPNPKACIEDSITHVNQILEEKMKEFMEHIFMEGDNSMPKSCRQLHLSCMKLFHMFYNSANNFDCDTALVDDIKKAIYLPIRKIHYM